MHDIHYFSKIMNNGMYLSFTFDPLAVLKVYRSKIK